MNGDKFCRNCGEQIRVDFKFCPNCGTKTNNKRFLLEESWFASILDGLCIYFIINAFIDIFANIFRSR